MIKRLLMPKWPLRTGVRSVEPLPIVGRAGSQVGLAKQLSHNAEVVNFLLVSSRWSDWNRVIMSPETVFLSSDRCV